MLLKKLEHDNIHNDNIHNDNIDKFLEVLHNAKYSEA